MHALAQVLPRVNVAGRKMTKPALISTAFSELVGSRPCSNLFAYVGPCLPVAWANDIRDLGPRIGAFSRLPSAWFVDFERRLSALVALPHHGHWCNNSVHRLWSSSLDRVHRRGRKLTTSYAPVLQNLQVLLPCPVSVPLELTPTE